MTYATLLQSEESLKSNYLAILQPRYRPSGWALYSGFVWSISYTKGDIVSIAENGTTLTEGSSTSLSAGYWYYDSATETLYVRTLQSADPETLQVVVTYSIYTSTIDGYFYSDPLDDTTEVVYYEPIITDTPEIKSSTEDSLFGSLPVQTSTISLSNADHIFETHIYDSSFNNATIKIYHWIDELTVANCSLVYNGLMSNIKYDTSKITINIVDRIDEFTKEYRNADTSFFNTTDFPNVNPSFIGKPIRYVYGLVNGFKPVNVDYVAENPTTSDNRDYVVMGEQTGIGEISRTVPASPSSTTTRTYLNFCEGIIVGDTVYLDHAINPDYYVEVTNVDYVNGYIEHAAISSAMNTGDVVKKGFVSRIDIIQQDIKYTAFYGRDYTVSTAMAAGCSGFSFSSSLESNIGLPNTLSPSDIIICRVYGRVNDLTANAVTFGANDTYTNNITNPVMVLYDLLKTRLGLGESRINLSQFGTVRTSTATQAIGLVIPESESGNMPKYKELILKILETSLLRIYLDSNLKWTIAELSPLTTATDSITSQDIFNGTFNYTFDYKEIISDVIVEYGREEYSIDTKQDKTYKVTASSDYARYTHNIEKQKTFHSLHFREADAQQTADRLSYALGDRIGTFTFTTDRKFFPSLINDTISLSREKLPNFEYVEGTENTVEGSIVDIQRSMNKISIKLDDQKGIEDNSGAW